MGTAAIKKTNIIHYIIVALLCFGFRFLPPFAALTPFGMGILGAFLGAVYGWMFIDMIYPSFLALVGCGLLIGMNQMVTASFGSTVISMIFIYLIIAVCNETGAINMLVNKLLTAKIMIGRPWFMIWLIFFAGICLGGLNSVVMIVIFLEFLSTICKQVGIPFKSKTAVLMALGTVYAISLGQIMIPFMGLGLTLVAVYSAMFHTTLEFLPWIAMILPLNLVMITSFTLLMRFVFRCDVSPLKNVTAEMLGRGAKATKDQKTALSFFFAFMLCMMCSSIQQLGILYKIFSTLSMFGITAIIICIMMVWRRSDGTPLLNFRIHAAQIGWEPVLLTAFIMLIGTYMNAPEAGISASLSTLIAPLTQFSPYVFILIALGLGAILTNFATNLIIIIIIMPLVVTFAGSVGMPALGILCLLFMATHICLATPAASPQTGITFANPLVDKSLAMKYGAAMVVLLFIIQMAAGLLWMNIVF